MIQENNQEIYHKETAGDMMVTGIPTVSPQTTVEEIIQLLSDPATQFDTVNYIYVTNTQHKLRGVISLKDIFKVSPKTKSEAIMLAKDLVTARASTDQERIAQLAIRHNIKAIPVVNKDNKLLGVVPSDTILYILHRENTEDFLKTVGIGKFHESTIDLLKIPRSVYFGKRLPWLMIGMLGGTVAASIVSYFEMLLQQMIILASFIPTIVYISDAVGTQTQTILIRNLAQHEDISLYKVLQHEIPVSMAIGLVLSSLIGIIAALFWRIPLLTLILSLSIFITSLIATCIAVMLPILFKKLGFDPAISSGPLATVVRDMLSILTYLSIAMILISIFP